MLLNPLLGAMAGTFFVARFFAVKTRLIEKCSDTAMVRKLSTSREHVELNRLREQNSVMRNLLIDTLEKENSAAAAATNAN